MHRLITFSGMFFLFLSFVHAQTVAEEGRAWLDRHNAPSEINVNGMWQDEEWGRFSFVQEGQARDIKGDSDGWKIDGVASGKQVFLLFSDSTGTIAYSAILSLEQEGRLRGGYIRGLMDEGTNKDNMLVERVSGDVVLPALGGREKNALVVVYRKKGNALGFMQKATDPPVYLDGRQLVWMDNGRYISFLVAPGEHRLTSEYEDKPVIIQAAVGDAFYMEINLKTNGWGGKHWGSIKQVKDKKGRKDIRNLKPIDGKNVVAESIVLLNEIAVD